MPNSNEPRLVLAVRAWREVRLAYEMSNVDAVETQLKLRIDKVTTPPSIGQPNPATQFEVVALPSNAPIPNGLTIESDDFRKMLVFGLVMTGGPKAAKALAAAVEPAFGADASIGADLAVSPSQNAGHFWSHWCPDEAGYGLVGDRAMALRTIRAEQPPLAAAGLPGPGRVNVVFVDTGLPLALLPPGDDVFKGWPVLEDPLDSKGPVRLPGKPLTGHGEMVALNARGVIDAVAPIPAPKLQLLDCPVIPDGITRLPVFLNSVIAALFSVWSTILWSRVQEEVTGQPRTGWVVCNAWGVFDPSLESPEVPYADNPAHPVAIALKFIAALGVDIVFAAGNCGQFCPNARCHPDYTGPGRSINGANALAEVLTVGAVRNDRLWLGYSGQGPGIAGMTHDKPDLCAPSQFESDGHAAPNTGTSAACGLAAGAVALLRTRWPSAEVSPAILRGILREKAAQPYGPTGWQDRTGHGILDVAATVDRLKVVAPQE